jgi:hypothetical protein
MLTNGRRPLDLLGDFEGPPRSSRRLAPRPYQNVLLQPDGACAESRNRFREVRSLHVAGCSALADAEQFGYFGEAGEFQRHAANRKSRVGLEGEVFRFPVA